MKKPLLMLVVLLGVLLSGCCSCQERYRPFLTQVRDNLANDIRPKYAKALMASGRPADLIKNDLGLVDDTVSSLDRVLESGATDE